MNKQIEYEDYYVLLHMGYFLWKPFKFILTSWNVFCSYQNGWVSDRPDEQTTSTTRKVQNKTKVYMLPFKKWNNEFPLY